MLLPGAPISQAAASAANRSVSQVLPAASWRVELKIRQSQSADGAFFPATRPTNPGAAQSSPTANRQSPNQQSPDQILALRKAIECATTLNWFCEKSAAHEYSCAAIE
jgi:hypothetical protein